MRPTACCLLLLLGLLASPAVHAQDWDDEADLPMDDFSMDALMEPEPVNVARMTDSDLSCEQLYAESDWIEARIAQMPKPEDPLAQGARMQEEMLSQVEKQQRAMRARGMASSLLSMVPGVGGLAASAMSAGSMTPDVSEPMNRYMQEMQASQELTRALAEQKARKAHVTNLFLARGCRVSALDQVQVQAARRRLEGGTEPDAAPAPAVAALPAADTASLATEPAQSASAMTETPNVDDAQLPDPATDTPAPSID